MTTVTPTIVTEGLHKLYGKVHILNVLALGTDEGNVLNILGTNGSGNRSFS